MFVKDELGARDSWEWEQFLHKNKEFLNPDWSILYNMLGGKGGSHFSLVIALATALADDTSTTV